MILSLDSNLELDNFFEGICGGIPFLSEIAHYGSLQKVLSENTLVVATDFLDTVILFEMIEIITLMPLTEGSAIGKFMVNPFTGDVVAIVSLFKKKQYHGSRAKQFIAVVFAK